MSSARSGEIGLTVVDDRKSEDYRGRDHHVAGCQVLGRCLPAGNVGSVALEPDVLGADVVDVHDVTEPGTGRLGVQCGLVPGRADRLAAGFGPQICLAGDVKVDALDLICPGRDGIDQQLLHVVQIGRLDSKRRLAFVAQELAVRPEPAPSAPKPKTRPLHRPVRDAVPAQHLAHCVHRLAGLRK